MMAMRECQVRISSRNNAQCKRPGSPTLLLSSADYAACNVHPPFTTCIPRPHDASPHTERLPSHRWVGSGAHLPLEFRPATPQLWSVSWTLPHRNRPPPLPPASPFQGPLTAHPLTAAGFPLLHQPHQPQKA